MVLAAGARCLLRRHGRRSIVVALLCLSAAALFLLITGRVAGFRILGRHCAPLFPSLLLLLGWGLMTLWEQRHWSGRWVVAGFICCNLLSCLSVRFAERHAKDNYREAAALVEGKK